MLKIPQFLKISNTACCIDMNFHFHSYNPLLLFEQSTERVVFNTVWHYHLRRNIENQRPNLCSSETITPNRQLLILIKI